MHLNKRWKRFHSRRLPESGRAADPDLFPLFIRGGQDHIVDEAGFADFHGQGHKSGVGYVLHIIQAFGITQRDIVYFRVFV